MADRSRITTAAILAGGRATRLGGAKASAELAGRPLISHPIAAAREAGLDPLVVAKRGTALPPLDCELAVEPDEPFHPLVGLITALERHPEGVVALGCDMPFVTGALLAELAARRPPAAAAVDGRLEPLLGLYDERALPVFREALEAEATLRGTVARLEPQTLGEDELERFGDPTRLVISVDSPEALERAGTMLG